MAFLDIKNSIIADTVYVDDTLVAKDVSITLPEVKYLTADVNAMGSVTLPLAGMIETMEFTISKVGLDLGLLDAVTPEAKEIECRWIQESLNAEGVQTHEAWKAFIKGIPQSIPSLGVNPGETSTGEIRYTVFSYKLFLDGDEKLVIDKLNNKITINKTEFYPNVEL